MTIFQYHARRQALILEAEKEAQAVTLKGVAGMQARRDIDERLAADIRKLDRAFRA